jgi:anthranilate synthase component 1
MQIIADLESGPRGLYAGAVGYSGFADLLEFAIAIRTIRVKNGLAEFSTGAGIVADSIPEKEFDETGHKAQAMIRAVRSIGDKK